MKRVSILGCGWLGFPLAKAFIQKGHTVKGSTTRAERLHELSAAGITPYEIKAAEGSWVGENIANFLTCDILIICIPPGTKRNPLSKHALEVERLMQLIKNGAFAIKTIIYTSSTSIYKNSNQILSEDAIQTESDAGNTILYQAEQAVRNSSVDNKIIFRLGGLTGYERMLARFFAGKQELSGGNEPVNLIHRDDVVASILYVLEKNSVNTIVNACSPLHPTRRDFYTSLCKRFHLETPHFPVSLDTDWKEISSDKLSAMGYAWIYPNPTDYSYTY